MYERPVFWEKNLFHHITLHTKEEKKRYFALKSNRHQSFAKKVTKNSVATQEK
jgi:hypothetical protein